MAALLRGDDLHKHYGKFHALRGISLDVVEGEGFAVIGPNGAGKTTLFKVLTGEVPASNGTIRFADQDVTTCSAHDRVRRGMGRTFQVARIFPDFTPLMNVVAAVEARQRGRGEGARSWYRSKPSIETLREADAQLAAVGLSSALDAQAKFLSHGDKKRLELAITLAGRPRVLMLDEPTAGMSPSDRVATTALIAQLQRDYRLTIVITEHDMGVIFGIADRIMVMNQGEMIAVGTVEEIRAHPTVRSVYLGEELYDANN